MVLDHHFHPLGRRMVWRTLTFLCVWVVWLAVLRMDVSSNHTCRRCHLQWRSFYLVSQSSCKRLNSSSSVSEVMEMMLDRYNGMIGMGLALSFVVFAELLGSRKPLIHSRDYPRRRELDWLSSISRMLLVFAGAFACWLYFLQLRSSREHCITRVARLVLLGTWEIVSVRPCQHHPRDFAVLARQMFSNNRVLLLLGIDLALTAMVVVEVITMSLQRWWLVRLRGTMPPQSGRGLVPFTATISTPPSVALVTMGSGVSGSSSSSSSSSSTEQQLQHNLSTATIRSSDDKSDDHPAGADPILLHWSSRSVSVDSPASPQNAAVRRLDRILEAMDESNGGSTIFQASFSSSSHEGS